MRVGKKAVSYSTENVCDDQVSVLLGGTINRLGIEEEGGY